MKKNLLTGLAITLLATVQVYAADAKHASSTLPAERPLNNWSEAHPHVGLLVGVADPEGSFKSTTEYGVDVGYQPYIPFGLGAELTHLRTRSDADELLDRTTLLMKATYNFGGTTPIIKESFVGVGVGPVIKNDGTDIAIAPLVGFDIPLKEESVHERDFYSLGLHAKYMFVSSSDPKEFSVNAALKYWY